MSNGDQKLDYTVGAYYKDEKRDVDDNFTFLVPVIAPGFVDNPQSHSIQKGKSWAVFADGDYQLTERWAIQAGIRYFSDSKEFRQNQIKGSVFPIGFPRTGDVKTGKDSATATSPKLGLTFKINPKVLLFAKYTEGFRAGGANTIPLDRYPEGVAAFGPEKLKAFEIGMKATPSAESYVNLYIYKNKVIDTQLSFRTRDDFFSYVDNAGSATMKGLELEAGTTVAESLRLGLAYAYIDATIGKDIYAKKAPPDLVFALPVKAGNQLPFVSKNKVSLFANYERQLTSTLRGNIDGRYRVASKSFSDASNTPIYENDTTKQLFLRLGISGKWGSLSLFGDNLLNRPDTTAKFGPVGPGLYVFNSLLRPRNYGLEFKGTF